MMQRISDVYGRSFKSLRVSLLDNCNFGCTYCTVGDEGTTTNRKVTKAHLSSCEMISLIQKLHLALDFKVIRLTGGEPLLYSQLTEVVRAVKDLGIEGIKLTTNGFLLERQAQALKDAGLQSINVSLDAIDEDVFFLMSKRNHVQRVLHGIEAAVATGLNVKLNTVLMKGINDGQIIPLLEYAFKQKIAIRFLEVMSMGHLYHTASKYLVKRDEILHTIAGSYDFVPTFRKPSSTAHYWKTSRGHVFGIIANESLPFCHDCNRLRLDSKGNIYGCLSSNQPINISSVTDTELQGKLQEALGQKQALKFSGSELSMLQIGG